MNNYMELIFQLNGGWTTVWVNLAFNAVKWVVIGALFRMGWGIIG